MHRMQNLLWGAVKLAITAAGAAAGLVFWERAKLRPRLDDPDFELWPELGAGKHYVSPRRLEEGGGPAREEGR